jgi:hypothetical protein
MPSITSADAVIVISISDLYPAPQQLQGFVVDDIYETSELMPTETMMGVDGRLSYGAINVPVVQTFTFMADSVSNDIFEQWAAQQRLNTATYVAQMTTLLPSRQKEYTHTNGALTAGKLIPGAGRVLRPRTWQITWESVLPNNI